MSNRKARRAKKTTPASTPAPAPIYPEHLDRVPLLFDEFDAIEAEKSRPPPIQVPRLEQLPRPEQLQSDQNNSMYLEDALRKFLVIDCVRGPSNGCPGQIAYGTMEFVDPVKGKYWDSWEKLIVPHNHTLTQNDLELTTRAFTFIWRSEYVCCYKKRRPFTDPWALFKRKCDHPCCHENLLLSRLTSSSSSSAPSSLSS